VADSRRSTTATLAGRARRWARRRQGPDPSHVVIVTRRIYALPTAAGALFGLSALTMLLGAMNYNNNLGFALAFLLAALGVVSIHHCHRNLLGMGVRVEGHGRAFLGEALPVHLVLDSPGGPAREALELRWEDEASRAATVPAGGSLRISLPLRATRRGRLALPVLQVTTRYPLGLLRAWTWIWMDADAVVYPRPEPPGRHAEPQADPARSGRDATRGEEDFSALRPAHTGDPPGRIAWKTYARTGQLLVQDFRGGGAPATAWLDWNDHPGLATESRLSRLARRALDAHATGALWGLRLPATRLGPAAGDEHLHRCLTALALFDPDGRGVA
jgi:uncharacterized protein (DUF58 family)